MEVSALDAVLGSLPLVLLEGREVVEHGLGGVSRTDWLGVGLVLHASRVKPLRKEDGRMLAHVLPTPLRRDR